MKLAVQNDHVRFESCEGVLGFGMAFDHPNIPTLDPESLSDPCSIGRLNDGQDLLHHWPIGLATPLLGSLAAKRMDADPASTGFPAPC
jgi:hypothetical protein